jgi:folate-dependent phosphoribosylglycinamide formyltransferase PurN
MTNLTNHDNSRNVTFGFLSTIDAPLLPWTLAAALANDCQNIVIICDSKLSSEKDKRLWQERTGGAFDGAANGGPTIYNLGAAEIPFYFVNNHNSEQTIAIINSLGIDCLFNAGTPRKLSKRIIDSAVHGVVNVHPGLLPEYRGCSCVEWAIFNDDKIGNTAHYMDEGYDTGPLITTECYEFPKNADYQSIRVKVYREGCALAGRVLRAIKTNRTRPSDGISQHPEQGKHWSPISDEQMAVVLRKIHDSKYRYQVL